MPIKASTFELLNETTQAIDLAENQDISANWYNFLHRFEAYSEISNEADLTAYQRLNNWSERRIFKQRLHDLQNAAKALSDLNKISDDDVSPDEKMKIKQVLSQKIDIYLAELELAQERILQKIQSVKRVDVTNLNKALIEAQKNYKKNLADIAPLMTSSQATNLRQFIKRERPEIDVNRKINLSSRIAAAVDTGSDLLHFIADLEHGLHAIASFLKAIPVVSAVISAIPTVLTAIKAWTQDKSTSKKVVATGIAVLAVVVLVNLGLATAATGGLAVGLVTIGLIKNQIYPWVKARNKLKAVEAEISAINSREETLNNPPIHSLITSEKHSLLSKLEQTYQGATKEEKAALSHSMKLVAAGTDIDAIRKDANVARVLSGHSLEDYLKATNANRLKNLNTLRVDLRNDNYDKTAKMINGVVGLVGAILLLIPTPPTLLAGAALLAVNSIVGVSLQYDLPGRFVRFISKLISKKPTATPEAEKVESPNPHPSPVHEISHSAHPTHEATTAELYHELDIKPQTTVPHPAMSAQTAPSAEPINGISHAAPSAKASPASGRNPPSKEKHHAVHQSEDVPQPNPASKLPAPASTLLSGKDRDDNTQKEDHPSDTHFFRRIT